jgi:hypothetical protein
MNEKGEELTEKEREHLHKDKRGRYDEGGGQGGAEDGVSRDGLLVGAQIGRWCCLDWTAATLSESTHRVRWWGGGVVERRKVMGTIGLRTGTKPRVLAPRNTTHCSTRPTGEELVGQQPRRPGLAKGSVEGGLVARDYRDGVVRWRCSWHSVPAVASAHELGWHNQREETECGMGGQC